MKKLVLSALAGLFLCVVGFAEERLGPPLPPPPGPPAKFELPPPPFVEKEIVNHLNLTEKQRDEIEAIYKEERPKVEELIGKLRENMVNLREEMEKYKSDENRIRELVEIIIGIHKQIFEIRVNSFLEIKKILTPQQFDAFKKELKSLKERRRHHFPSSD